MLWEHQTHRQADMASSVINSFHYWLTLHSSGTMGCFHQQHPQLRIEASTTGAFVLNKYQPAASPTVISDFCRTKTTLCWQKDKDYPNQSLQSFLSFWCIKSLFTFNSVQTTHPATPQDYSYQSSSLTELLNLQFPISFTLCLCQS